jgi:uncharacterized membrane protein
MAFLVTAVVLLVLLGAMLLRLDQPWVLAVVAVVTFLATYWAVCEEHRRKPI